MATSNACPSPGARRRSRCAGASTAIDTRSARRAGPIRCSRATALSPPVRRPHAGGRAMSACDPGGSPTVPCVTTEPMPHSPDPASAPVSPDRRTFLKALGATLALTGIEACVRGPAERILPYARQPEELIPGRPRYYATTLTHDGHGIGVLVESHLGRPTRVSG